MKTFTINPLSSGSAFHLRTLTNSWFLLRTRHDMTLERLKNWVSGGTQSAWFSWSLITVWRSLASLWLNMGITRFSPHPRARAVGSNTTCSCCSQKRECHPGRSILASWSKVGWLRIQGQFHRMENQSIGMSVITSTTSTGASLLLDIHNQHCQEEGEDSYKRQISSFSV